MFSDRLYKRTIPCPFFYSTIVLNRRNQIVKYITRCISDIADQAKFHSTPVLTTNYRTRSIVVALSTSMNCIFPCLLCFCCTSKVKMCRMYQFCEVISRVQSLISDKIGYSTGWHTLYEYSIISDSQNLVRYCIISANEYDVCCHTIKGHRVSYSKHNEASVMVRG